MTARPPRPAKPFEPPKQVNGQSGLIDANGAGELLAVPASWVLAEARADRIPHVRLGPKYVRFEAAELAAWWQSRRRGPWRTRAAAAAAARAGNGPAWKHHPCTGSRPQVATLDRISQRL